MFLSRTGVCRLFVLCAVLATALHGRAQGTAPVLMLSDIHFDPFHDPSKVAQLVAEPPERWPAILDGAAAPTDAAALAQLQAACGARSLDTAWPLLKRTLAAARRAEARPLFTTVSGDLLTHEFACRFAHTTSAATPERTAAFAAKVVAFVVTQVRTAAPRNSPVYSVLGNNDTPCADYHLTPGDSFSTDATGSFRMAALAPAMVVSALGDYSVALPAPVRRGRLVVLNDIFASRQFLTCGGTDDRAAERTQIDWLRQQLTAARMAREQVWVMAHIPPGVDVYASFRRFVFQPRELCTAQPRPFLADTALADALLDYPDVVRLALFGHTHMDEFRVLARPGPSGTEAEEAVVPAKLVPSVSPVLGNHPAFLVGTIDARTAVLDDWRSYVSPSPEGSAAPWAEAYRFIAAYHLPDFGARSVLQLATSFVEDPTGQAPRSSTFRQHFFAGDLGLYALGVAQIWPAYACAIREDRPSAVQRCLCAAQPLSPPRSTPESAPAVTPPTP